VEKQIRGQSGERASAWRAREKRREGESSERCEKVGGGDSAWNLRSPSLLRK